MGENNGKQYMRTLRTIGITGLAFVINYMITFFLTPYITNNVGTAAYGFVTLAKNCAQYATYITGALNSFATRFIAVEYHRKNMKQANIYFSSTFYGDVFLCTGILAVLLVGVHFLEHIFSIPVELVSDVKLLFCIVFVKFWLGTMVCAFESSAYIKNKLDIRGIFNIVGYLLEAVVLLALFALFHAKIWFVGIGILINTLTTVVGYLWISRRYTPELKVNRADFRMSAVMTLVGNGIWSSVIYFSNFLMHGLDLMITNLILTPLAMGQLAIAHTIDVIVRGVYTIVAGPFQPIFLKSYSNGNTKKLIQEFVLSMSLSSFFSNVCFSGFLALGLPYYKLWIPNEDIELIYRITLIVIFTCVPSGTINPLHYIYTLTVKKKIPCLMTASSGLLNVFSMYLLLTYTDLGLYAVVLTTAVIVTILMVVIHPLYMTHLLGIPWYTFYPAMLREFLSCGILCVLFRFFVSVYTPRSWPALFLSALVYGLVGALIHFGIVLDRRYWKRILGKLKKMVGK